MEYVEQDLRAVGGRLLIVETLGTAAFAADMAQIDVLSVPALAAELKKQQKHVILLWLAGGASQLETWDPKPGRRTGGPYRAIQTSVPGVAISELMPKMAARLAQSTAIIRSLNTRNADHGGGSKLMMRGRMDEANLKYPDLGAMLARELGRADSQVPDYVAMYLMCGQMLEGMVLSPLLVGDRIGLHPVAVIFAVMAGGQLFGFFGVLLALPVAAVIVVLLRHWHADYVRSPLYEA